MQLLARNSRIPTLEIAEELNKSTITINNRIKRLVALEVILKFHITIDWERIGYKWFKVDFYLKDYNKIYDIIKYVEANPHLAYIDKTFGYADLELELIVRDLEHLTQIIDGISEKFPEMIRSKSYFSVSKSHKWVEIPEE